MRILLINHEFTITGASVVFLRLANHLYLQGHTISVLSVNPADGPIKTHYQNRGIPIVSNANLRNYDLVIANTVCTASIVLETAGHVKCIWFLHETEVGLTILLRNPKLAAAFRVADAVIYQSEYQSDVYKSFTYMLDPVKFHIVPNGVDITQADIERDAIPAKTRSLRIVQVGSVEPRKRPSDLINAVASSQLDIECILCGKIFEIDDSARVIVAKEPTKYRLIGETERQQTLAWIESADIFCLASGSESQPVSVFEAALLARPLLLSDLLAYRNLFAHGRNCLMFPPGHVGLLAMGLRTYAANPRLRDEMGAAARQRALPFNVSAFHDRFSAVINSVMCGR
jgi:glycosyltransferase involved in cell wall biosynthesis